MSISTEPASRRSYRKGDRRREQIVSAASAVFAEFGFAGGSVRAIAERVGVSPATLLQHFGSKEGLLMAVLEAWDRRTVESTLRETQGLEFFRRMPEVMRDHQHDRELLQLFTMLAAEATGPSHPAHGFMTQRYRRNRVTLTTHLREAVAAGEIPPMSDATLDHEARLMDAVLDGIGLQWLLDPSTDMVSCVDDYVTDAIARWQRPR